MNSHVIEELERLEHIHLIAPITTAGVIACLPYIMYSVDPDTSAHIVRISMATDMLRAQLGLTEITGGNISIEAGYHDDKGRDSFVQHVLNQRGGLSDDVRKNVLPTHVAGSPVLWEEIAQKFFPGIDLEQELDRKLIAMAIGLFHHVPVSVNHYPSSDKSQPYNLHTLSYPDASTYKIMLEVYREITKKTSKFLTLDEMKDIYQNGGLVSRAALKARMAAICDVFDARFVQRPYQPKTRISQREQNIRNDFAVFEYIPYNMTAGMLNMVVPYFASDQGDFEYMLACQNAWAHHIQRVALENHNNPKFLRTLNDYKKMAPFIAMGLAEVPLEREASAGASEQIRIRQAV